MRPVLGALAKRLGILPEYVDIRGHRRPTSDATRIRLAEAMGFEASDEAAAARSLRALERPDEIAPPVRVIRHGARRGWSLPVRLPRGSGGRRHRYRLRLEEEEGRAYETEGTLGGGDGARPAYLRLPSRPGPGYHRVRLSIQGPRGHHRAECSLIVAPGRCTVLGELLPDTTRASHPKRFGIWTNLYTVTSRRDWGAGDLTDLGELVDWAGTVGAVFMGINPLHALRNRGGEVSPYSPVSRLFRNPLYLDVTAVPELADSREARERLRAPEFRAELEHARSADRVDYERIAALKTPLLEALHRTFIQRHRGRSTERGRAYRDYLARKGTPLDDFATFLAIEEHLAEGGTDARRWRGWRSWPAELRDPRSSAVGDFRRDHDEAVDFHRYVQFELDRQLGAVAERATAAGVPVGIYGDLAVGSAPDGSDTWSFPRLFAPDIHVGAPPDDYSAQGQDWGLPPLDPRRLRQDGYRYWIHLLRSALEHTGALRIDHVMGLLRLFWIPSGRPAAEGAYVRYPWSDLLGILALESRRQNALIVGEDLGTVPRGFPALLSRWGILSSSVLYFERDRRGGFRPSKRYSARALVTAHTHDHPPLAGWWTGRDLRLRREAGAIESDEDLRRALDHREDERRRLVHRLVAEGAAPADEPPSTAPEVCAAAYRFLSRTPAPLVGVSLDDLVCERDPVNLPGVGSDGYPNWSRRMTRTLEGIRSDPDVAAVLDGVGARKHRNKWNES